MITYVDTSTLMKLIVDEEGSDRAAMVWSAADHVASVGLIVVEARAALASATRGRRLTAGQHAKAKRQLRLLITDLHLVEPHDDLIGEAAELAETEALRGYDAMHLAAALELGAEVFTSADAGLCAAAARRGLHVANPLVS